MSGTQRNVRSMRNVKTSLGGGADDLALAYKAYLRITCLEMERERRMREKESAQKRIAAVDSRMREIDGEKDRLLKAQGERTVDGQHSEDVSEAGGPRTGAEPGRDGRGGVREARPMRRNRRDQDEAFRIRY